ncbi:MAG: P-loop NTPase [Oscillospiraceae bacterium]|nr:P-loop NTPase [Oscillospiraceae bacterium]
MSTVIAVLSGKGGTGKSTAAAALSCALSELGRSVVCVDADTELRNADLCLGLGDRALLDYGDVLEGRCSLEDALLPLPDFPRLRLLAAPPQRRPGSLEELIPQLEGQLDYCVVDCPGGLGDTVAEAACLAQRAIVVATADPCSHRDGERTAQLLRSALCPEGLLLINRVRPRQLKAMGITLDDSIDLIGLRLLGYVPEDERVPLALGAGRPLLAEDRRPRRGAAAAFRRIARRLDGQSVPLP